MKKSKILGISLGTITLVTATVATPFIVTSCTSSNEVQLITDYKITGKPVQLLPDAEQKGYILKTNPGNVYNLYSNDSKQWKFSDLNSISLFGSNDQNKFKITNFISKTKLEALGFDVNLLNKTINPDDDLEDREIKITIGIRCPDGSLRYAGIDDINYLNFDKENKIVKTKEYALIDTIKVFQINNKKLETSSDDNHTQAMYNAIEKHVNFSFKLIISPAQK